MYRTNAQSRSIEDALRRKNISYQVYGGLSFYQRKEIKDVLGYLRVIVNPNDEESIKRIINFPIRGIGQTTREKITIAASEEGVSPWHIVTNLQDARLPINASTLNKLSDFQTLIRSFQVLAESQDAYELGNHIASTTGMLKEFYTDKTPEGVSRYENIQELLSGMKEFTEIPVEDNELEINNPRSIGKFLEDVALLTDVDNKDSKDDDQPKVSMMTIHSAKGLEFPYVFYSRTK